MNNSNSVAIVGSGAMGSRFGAHLFEAGYNVTLYDVWEEHISSIQQNGLKVLTPENEEKVLPIKAYVQPNAEETYDFVLVFTKSQFTKSAMTTYKSLISEETYLISLQNGIGNFEMLSEFIDREKIIIGVTTHSCDLLGPGSIKIGGSGVTYITQLDTDNSAKLQQFATMLNQASITTNVSKDTLIIIWEKLAFNAAYNTLTAITRLSTGQVGNHPLGKELIGYIVDEVTQVAKQLGILINKERVMETIETAAAPDTSGHHLPSMLQDILKKQKTEIEAINGSIIREADNYNIAVPCNRIVYNLIKMMEEHF